VARINAGGVLPPGVRIVPIYDREDLVKITTKTVVKNIIEGVLFILIIQWLFLGDLAGTEIDPVSDEGVDGKDADSRDCSMSHSGRNEMMRGLPGNPKSGTEHDKPDREAH